MTDYPECRVPATLVCVLITGLLVSCGGEGAADVAEGRYRVHIEGHLTDTLAGPAVFRESRGGVGIELGAQGGPGFSIELGPRPLRARSYEIVAAELLEDVRADSVRRAIAFLTLDNTRFEASSGSISLSHVGEGEVQGTLDVVMERTSRGQPDDSPIWVTGELRATPN